MLTPLQPREFFQGTWKGRGELIPAFYMRFFARRESFDFSSKSERITENIWVVYDSLHFDSGWKIDRKMFSELVAPDRLHVTADDMPGGADIFLHEHGFRFSPYHVLGYYRGRTWKMRFTDECILDDDGFIHDDIKMHFLGIRVAEMRIGPIKRITENTDPPRR